MKYLFVTAIVCGLINGIKLNLLDSDLPPKKEGTSDPDTYPNPTIEHITEFKNLRGSDRLPNPQEKPYVSNVGTLVGAFGSK